MPSRILPFRPPGGPRRDARAAIRVLVVDDDEGMRGFVDAVLTSAGYVTALAEDGDEALALAANLAPFDLLVTDEMMPRMRGHQLARYMRERYAGIKVLYLSGFRRQLFSDKGGSLWNDEAFLDKPCTPEQLIDAVSLLVEGAHHESSPDTSERT